MAIGISKTFPMDLDLVARLMQIYGRQPGARLDEVGAAVGLNKPKIDGLNKLMGYLGVQQERRLTALGELILENDPYLKDIGTLSVFHYLLCSNENAEVWYFAGNEFIPQNKQFTREEFEQALDRAGIGRGNTRLKADRSLLLNAYTSVEYHALQGLGYMKRVEGNSEIYQTMAIEKIPALVLGFVLYDRRQKGVQTSTIAINNLLTLNAQVGKTFLLQREPLMMKLKQLEAKGIVGINQVADLDNIAFKHLDNPLSLLADYYRERA